MIDWFLENCGYISLLTVSWLVAWLFGVRHGIDHALEVMAEKIEERFGGGK